eukprot:6199976-Pleurochrysis_carterae.AAC.2
MRAHVDLKRETALVLSADIGRQASQIGQDTVKPIASEAFTCTGHWRTIVTFSCKLDVVFR